MKGLLALAVVASFASVAISGCLIAPSDAKDASTSPSVSASPGADSTGTGNATNATLPVASIVVSSNGTILEADNGTIAAPAAENLTFDGANSTGANLTFAWDFGDDATSDNATTEHAFAAAGLYNVTLTVTDAGKHTNSTTVVLNVTSAAPASGVLVRTQKNKFTGDVTSVDEATCSANTGLEEQNFKWVISAAEPDGTAVTGGHTVITLAGDDTSVDIDLYLQDAKGKEIASSHGSTSDEKIELPALAPGTYNIYVIACAAILTTVTVNASVDLLTA